jgi:hypothetical protein
VTFPNHNTENVHRVLTRYETIQQPHNIMIDVVLLCSRLSSHKVCMKFFNMACPNFGERGETNLQSRLFMGYIGSLASGPDNSSHGCQE